MFSLEARTAGRNPPTSPIITAKTKQEITIDELSAKEKVISEKEL